MNNYEVTFIVDPVLSGDEIKATAQVYEQMLKNEGCNIVHIDEMGLKPLAYPINKRSSGVYYCYEYASETGAIISKMELALRRDERIMRFLTIALDKHGVKYNADKRNGLIGKVKKKVKPSKKEDTPSRDSRDRDSSSSRPPREAAPAVKPAPAPVVVPPPAPVVEPVAAVTEEE
ncbi:MAG TPA: 30S ribosomal protein S6 [Saprospiraceae bacterium]|nr:30S ribosomal protein S6 [Saprospiraceae bacterium]HPN71178.1 30S ribosomal protein S6 [Saprospiraceae bacterium]